MLGLYLHRESPIHAVGAPTKLVALVVVGAVAFLIDQIALLGGFLALIVAGFAVARLPIWRILRQTMGVVPILAAIFVFHGVFTDVATGMVVVLRIACLILAAILVTLTTRVSDMIACLETALRPLARFGVNPAKVSLVLSLTIRLIPALFDIAREVIDAQRARGLHRNPVAVVVPLVIRALRMGDGLADALEARGFDPD